MIRHANPLATGGYYCCLQNVPESRYQVLCPFSLETNAIETRFARVPSNRLISRVRFRLVSVGSAIPEY